MSLPPPPPASKTTKPPDTPAGGLAFENIAPGPARYRVVLNAQEGWGKTTLMAYAPKPVIIRSPQESGLVTLRKADRVPDVPTLVSADWPGLLATIRSEDLRQFDTVCFDALGGLEELCREHVFRSQFESNQAKFTSYGKGVEAMLVEWMALLAALEDLALHADIIVASHARVMSVKDPSAEQDYDRYVADVNKKLWPPTKRWADAVLFGTFFTAVSDEGRGVGGTDRVLYTEHRASHDAKNRWGMPATVRIPADPAKVYAEVFKSIK